MTIRISKPLLIAALVIAAGVAGYLIATETGDDNAPKQVVQRAEPCPEGSVASDNGSCISERRIDFNSQIRASLIEDFFTPDQADCVLDLLNGSLSDEDIVTIEAINASTGGDESQYPSDVKAVISAAEEKCVPPNDPSVPLE